MALDRIPGELKLYIGGFVLEHPHPARVVSESDIWVGYSHCAVKKP